METRAWKLTKRIIEWGKLHRMQGIPAPPWKVTEEEARYLHEDLKAKMAPPPELEGMRMQLALARGVPYEPSPKPTWPPPTWRELEGGMLYGVPLTILPGESVEHMVRADRAWKEFVADMREFERANRRVFKPKRLKRSNLIPGWMRRRLAHAD